MRTTSPSYTWTPSCRRALWVAALPHQQRACTCSSNRWSATSSKRAEPGNSFPSKVGKKPESVDIHVEFINNSCQLINLRVCIELSLITHPNNPMPRGLIGGRALAKKNQVWDALQLQVLRHLAHWIHELQRGHACCKAALFPSQQGCDGSAGRESTCLMT